MSDEVSAEERLWLALAAVPYGRVTSYGRLASLAGFSGRARWVGRQLGQLPEGSQLPWHRVVNSAGYSSLPAGSEGYTRQLTLLSHEGISVSDAGRIPARYFWPDSEQPL